jgi:hypothetical protein
MRLKSSEKNRLWGPSAPDSAVAVAVCQREQVLRHVEHACRKVSTRDERGQNNGGEKNTLAHKAVSNHALHRTPEQHVVQRVRGAKCSALGEGMAQRGQNLDSKAIITAFICGKAIGRVTS